MSTGFRESLDLSHIVRRFDTFAGTAGVSYVGEGQPGPAQAYERPPAHLYEPARAPGTGPHPALVGSGPSACSTSRAVAVRGPLFAWDPNRYYQDLGIAWPYVQATRKDLRRGYQQRDGQASVRLTYCLKQLLDDQVRRAYDALPLGHQYTEDIYVQEALRAKAADEASRSSAKGSFTTAEQVLDDWGYVLLTEEEAEEVDTARCVDTDPDTAFNETDAPSSVGAPWGYSFYLWRTQRWDHDRLADWQAALISAFDQHDIGPTLSVGLMGSKPQPYAIVEVADEQVVFLNQHEQVTPDLARAAAQSLHSQLTGAKHDALSLKEQ